MSITNPYIKGLKYELPHPFRADADRLHIQFHTNTYTQPDGVVRWSSNHRVPPHDILEYWAYIGKPFNYVLSEQTRQKEEAEVLAQYNKANAQRKPSTEEKHEMQMTFGTGTTVVNVITGRKTKL